MSPAAVIAPLRFDRFHGPWQQMPLQPARIRSSICSRSDLTRLAKATSLTMIRASAAIDEMEEQLIGMTALTAAGSATPAGARAASTTARSW
jgi:hypothetical protein